MKLSRLLSAAAATTVATIAQMIAAAPAYADHSYTYPAPAPGQVENTRDATEFLASDRQADVYGDWDFVYSITPDGNLFVTRIFASNLGDGAVVGQALQIDCGRGMFRDISQPMLFSNGSNAGTPLEQPIYRWLIFNRNVATGQAMMRTCEAAAQEEGIAWSWL